MAKSRGSNRAGRDRLLTIARGPVTRPQPSLTLPFPRLAPLPVKPSVLDDRRLFHFDRLARPAVAIQRVATRLRVAPRNFNRITFEQPDLVLICKRRKARRSVMFAIKKNGRNGQRRSRRNAYSSVGC